MSKKRTKAPAAQAATVDPDPLNRSDGKQREYQPELATNWTMPGLGRRKTPEGGYTITIDDPSVSPEQEAVIATIIVNPVFSEENQQRIAWFLSHAPELWRLLRTVTVDYLQFEQESCETFHQARTLLWSAAQRRPFNIDSEAATDEDMYRANIDRLSRELKSKAGAA